jgi:hypothetical protein
MSPDFNLPDFYLRGNMTDVVPQQNVETPDALLRNILNAAARVQDNPDEMMRVTSLTHRHPRTRVPKIFKKSRRNLKIQDARGVTRIKFQTADPQILGTTV